jgi:hypothetical protein
MVRRSIIINDLSTNGSTLKYVGCLINMFLIVTLLTFYNTYLFVNGHDVFQNVRDNLANLHHKILVAYHSSTFVLLVQSICKSRWSRSIKPGLTAVRLLGWRV